MKLVIVESPHKAKTISKYLGRDYVVLASGGHISDLPANRLAIDVEHGFMPEYEVNTEKKAIIEKMKKEIAKSDAVFLATDPDREGEAISWHLRNVLGLADEKNRIEFNEISQKAVSEALSKPRNLNLNLVDSQQARRVLDRLVGYKISPILSKKIRKGLSGGRVQSVALKMLVEREREIRAFKPEEYWNLFAFVSKTGSAAKYKTEFYGIDGKKTKITNGEQCTAIVEGAKQGVWSVEKVKRATSASRPNAPFTTSTMQQDAAHKLNMTAQQVMQIAQQLYEGVEIAGEGQMALVTYIRTDSVRVSQDAQKMALDHISATYGKDYLPPKPRFYSSGKGAQDAHEAIRPISVDVKPEDLVDKINRNQYRLYKLIYDRFLASQMADALYDTLNVTVLSRGDKNYTFNIKGRSQKFAGFTAVYSAYTEEKEESVTTLPQFVDGEALKLADIKSEQKFTKPPARYNDASIVKAMEENGIGRPSTYASIITVLAKRNYTEKEGKFIKPTELGEIVCDQLVKYFPDIMDTKFTADMELKLDKIEEGDAKWQTVIGDFYPPFIKEVLNASNDGEKVKLKEEETDVICEKCGAHMVVKEGRFGKFLACPNFPNCRNVKSYGEAVAKCPKCGSGIMKRFSKKGKPFYSCSGYPKCDFISWDIPAPHFCPDCGAIMKIVKDSKSTKYVCINKVCGRKEVVENSGEGKADKDE